MEANQVSNSALISAFVRGYHATHDEPKIFDDFLAMQLFTPEQRRVFESNLALALAFFDPERAKECPDPATALAAFIRVQSGPINLSRSRYAEDALEAAVGQGARQYVILGAGLDTFAFRRRDLVERLQIFEVDHLATQAYKRNRVAELGWREQPHVHYLPLDFTSQSVTDALTEAGYDLSALSFFSWLGVTYYLSRPVVLDTLRAIAGMAAAGSGIVFDYLDNDAFTEGKTARRVQLMQDATRRSGEPMITGFDPASLAEDLAGCGLHLRETLSPTDIEARYFQSRSDGFHAFEQIHFAKAVVA